MNEFLIALFDDAEVGGGGGGTGEGDPRAAQLGRQQLRDALFNALKAGDAAPIERIVGKRQIEARHFAGEILGLADVEFQRFARMSASRSSFAPRSDFHFSSAAAEWPKGDGQAADVDDAKVVFLFLQTIRELGSPERRFRIAEIDIWIFDEHGNRAQKPCWKMLCHELIGHAARRSTREIAERVVVLIMGMNDA